MKELLFWLHPKSRFGRCRLTVSRYHLLSLLKFIIWFAIGTMTGFGLSHNFLRRHQYSALSRPLCDRSYWLHLLKHHQQQQGNQQRRYLVQILVIHVSEESQLTFTLKHKIWHQTVNPKTSARNDVVHFIDQSLYQRIGRDDQYKNRTQLVPLAGLNNATFMQGLKMIIYHFLQSSELSHEFYCFVADSVQLDHQKLRRLLNSVSLFKPVLVEKETSKEYIQNPGCLLASNCSPANGMILSRPTLENALTIIRACMLSEESGPFLNFQSRFYECIKMSTLFECAESPKVSLFSSNLLSFELTFYFYVFIRY